MEAWATVVIVLVSNAIIGAVSVLTVRKQLKHSAEQSKMQEEAQREEEKRSRKREIRDEPLVRLRDELARMAEKVGRGVHLVTQFTPEKTPHGEKVRKDLEEAVEEWEKYIKSGVFLETLHMQFDHNIRQEAHKILYEYHLAYDRVHDSWVGKKKDNKSINDATEVVGRNMVRVSDLQLEIVRLREEL